MVRRKWSRERVISAIQYRVMRGWKYNCAYTKAHCSPLANAGCKYFGTWSKALKAAGVPVPSSGRNVWSKKEIIARIKTLSSQKQPLNNAYIKKNHPILYTVSCQYFGGWAQAVGAADFDYSEVRLVTHRKWSKGAIVREIQRRVRHGLSVRGGTVQREDSGLYEAATTHFGTPNAWAKAREAAGLQGKDARLGVIYDPRVIITELKCLQEEGAELNFGAMVGKPYSHLVAAGARIFGSYPKALRAAGISYLDVRKKRHNWWDRKKVIRAIRKLEKKGVRLNGGDMCALQPALYGAATRIFGTWSKAVEASGIPYRAHLRYWSTRLWLNDLSNLKARTLEQSAERHATKRRRTQ